MYFLLLLLLLLLVRVINNTFKKCWQYQYQYFLVLLNQYQYFDRSVFSKRQRITLRLLYAIGHPSVCLSVVCLSVTLVHPTQAVKLFGNFFSPYDSSGTLLFWCQKSLVGDAPFPLKFAFKVTDPTFKQRNFDQYRLIAPQP